ncbi:MAG: hypothetical protein HRT44_07905 [Bdellovibrionales bacterium]|nr:hypothetical protein [Bdellovibrionales bacterium]NQZ19163.1 hypothetical protein [Bdellovibrionales bacterium]
MKYLSIFILTMSLVACQGSDSDFDQPVEDFTEEEATTAPVDEETDEFILTSEEEEAFVESLEEEEVPSIEETNLETSARKKGFRFRQTKWRECKDRFTGNYSGYRCVNGRLMSNILKNYLNKHIKSCTDKAYSGRVKKVHIVHAGILGDRFHSPRSLHAESRAIDVKALRLTLSGGRQRTINYNNSTRAFYKKLRDCWGRAIHRFNGCPKNKGSHMLTGSIGWENKNHRRHLHLSVPYCVGSRYGAYYYRR